MAPQRNLTLTEELEKLEQSITLTLQEIDHNFSRAHRIVTSSILPIVENYAEHSKNVWESSKFWKQFFEASANVSLSSYEEPPEPTDETVTEDADATTPSASSYASPSQLHDDDDQTMTPQRTSQQPAAADEDETILSTTPPTQKTPRPKSKHRQEDRPSIATYSSPYETLKREIKGSNQFEDHTSSTLPSTPRNNPFQTDSSPAIPPPSTTLPYRTPKDDPLLHRILDKNWRLQATPHTTTRSKTAYPMGTTPAIKPRRNGDTTTTPSTAAAATHSEDLDSSPAMPAPELHSEIFGTPARRKKVPGVSVLTPVAAKKTPGGQQSKGKASDRQDIWDSDEDDDDLDLGDGMSPPKTLQFHVPQSRLLRTPAREASKKIVEDILLTAGGNVTDEFAEEDSPSVVKRGALEEDDTF
ncbi:MAG: hypothetical protein Q9222_006090 [Ikaeria aurantiellina]